MATRRAAGSDDEGAVATVVHEGRGGYVRVASGREHRYPIEAVGEGRFVITFPAGNRRADRHAHLAALEVLCRAEPEKWALERADRAAKTPSSARPALLRPLRALANAYADAHQLPRPPRMRLGHKRGRLRLRAGDAVSEGHVGAPTLLVGALVHAAAGREVLGRRTVWNPVPALWWRHASAFFELAAACLARGRVHDARDLAYVSIVETLYLEDVAEGTKPAPPPAVRSLALGRTSPLESESGAHLSVLRRLVARLAKAGRAEQVPLLRAMADVARDASYASPLTLHELVAPTALAMARHEDARREAALELAEALAGQLTLACAYREALPLCDVLVEAGLSLPGWLVERFVALAVLADPQAERDREALDAFAAANRERLRPQVAELEPWAALAGAHVRAGRGLFVRARGGDPCVQRPKKNIAALGAGEAERLLAAARAHLEHARRLLGATLETDVAGATFEATQRRKHLHEDFHALDADLHRAAGDARAALLALRRAHAAAERDAYEHKKRAHLAAIRALEKKVGR